MTAHDKPVAPEEWTAAQLRRLPSHERDAILEAAARLAEVEYRNNPKLTDFEAFGEENPHSGRLTSA